jgi:hypothetical protein
LMLLPDLLKIKSFELKNSIISKYLITFMNSSNQSTIRNFIESTENPIEIFQTEELVGIVAEMFEKNSRNLNLISAIIPFKGDINIPSDLQITTNQIQLAINRLNGYPVKLADEYSRKILKLIPNDLNKFNITELILIIKNSLTLLKKMNGPFTDLPALDRVVDQAMLGDRKSLRTLDLITLMEIAILIDNMDACGRLLGDLVDRSDDLSKWNRADIGRIIPLLKMDHNEWYMNTLEPNTRHVLEKLVSTVKTR